MKQITVLWGGKKQGAYLLDEPHVVIGRGRSAHISLDGNPIVSRQHAVIRQELDAHVLEDLGGANGTFVNDQKISQVRLRVGDRITLGKHTLRYEAGTPAARSISGAPEGAPEEGDSPETVHMMSTVAPGAAPPPPGPWSAGPGAAAGGPGQERTMAASKDELETLLVQMKIKAGPHLSVSRGGKIDLMPLDAPPVLVGHTDECLIRLKGSRWFGRIAASLETQGADWVIVPRSPFWNPVQVGSDKLRKKRKLTDGLTITAGDLKFRFSSGEQS